MVQLPPRTFSSVPVFFLSLQPPILSIFTWENDLLIFPPRSVYAQGSVLWTTLKTTVKMICSNIQVKIRNTPVSPTRSLTMRIGLIQNDQDTILILKSCLVSCLKCASAQHKIYIFAPVHSAFWLPSCKNRFSQLVWVHNIFPVNCLTSEEYTFPPTGVLYSSVRKQAFLLPQTILAM